MPVMLEVKGERQRRFRWRHLRFEFGRWIYLTVPDAGLGFRQWEWEPR